MSDRIRAQYFDSRFVYIWKVVYIQKTSKLPVAITNWRTAFSGLGSLRFTTVASLATPFIVLLDGQLLILRQLRCNVHVTVFFCPVEFNWAKGRWKTALESGAWLSLHFLILLVFRTEQGAWLKRNQYNWSRVLIFLSQELQTRPHLSSARNILSLHHTSAWLKQVLGFNMIPLRTKFDTETTVMSQRIKEREWERFSSPAGLLLRSEFTEFSDRQHNTGVGDKNIMFLHLPRKFRAGNLGLLSINFDFRNVIIQPMVVSSVWAKYKWKFMRDRFKLFFPRPLTTSSLARTFSRTKLK